MSVEGLVARGRTGGSCFVSVGEIEPQVLGNGKQSPQAAVQRPPIKGIAEPHLLKARDFNFIYFFMHFLQSRAG